MVSFGWLIFELNDSTQFKVMSSRSICGVFEVVDLEFNESTPLNKILWSRNWPRSSHRKIADIYTGIIRDGFTQNIVCILISPMFPRFNRGLEARSCSMTPGLSRLAPGTYGVTPVCVPVDADKIRYEPVGRRWRADDCRHRPVSPLLCAGGTPMTRRRYPVITRGYKTGLNRIISV